MTKRDSSGGTGCTIMVILITLTDDQKQIGWYIPNSRYVITYLDTNNAFAPGIIVKSETIMQSIS